MYVIENHERNIILGKYDVGIATQSGILQVQA